MAFSIIDYGLRDFLRDENNEVIVLDCETVEEAEEWLLSYLSETEWTNEGALYFNWNE